MKKEKEIVLYVEPNEMINQDQPAAGNSKTGGVRENLLYFPRQDTENFPSPVIKEG